MKVIMYLRKSTESEDRQVMSIPAQERELMLVLARQSLTLVGEPVREQQSAKHVGRPLFGDVVARIRRGEAHGIICWHLDRLARNPTDGAAIMQDLSDGRLKAVVTPDRTYTGTGDDGLMMCIIFGMATKFSVDLSRNVRRGYTEAAERGQWPCAAVPLGYLRDPVTKLCIPDPDRWDMVAQLWRRRIAGEPIARLADVAREELGLRTRFHRSRDERRLPGKAGKLVARSYIYNMLNDPFYAGLIVWNGKTFAGLHKPMITPREYYETQLGKRRTHQTALNLPFRGMLTCACGRGVTAERHVKRSGLILMYYRCIGTTRVPRRCEEPAVPRRTLEGAIVAALRQVQVPRAVVELVVDELSILQAKSMDMNAVIRRKREAQQRDVQDRQARLVQAFLAGLISEEEMAVEKKRNETLAAHAAAALDEQEDMAKVLELLKNKILAENDALERFVGADDERKSAIAGALCSNLVLSGRNVAVSLKEPFRTLAEISHKSIQIGMNGRGSTDIRKMVEEMVSRSMDSRASADCQHDHEDTQPNSGP